MISISYVCARFLIAHQHRRQLLAAKQLEQVALDTRIVHCVGASFAKPGGVLALTEDDWMQALGTNLLSAVRLDRAILPSMIEQRSGAARKGMIRTCSAAWRALASQAGAQPPGSIPPAFR
jgi:NAD(P)-dependent dehydrogenase (short-subunit alcohol dehydrogenase family)